VAACLNTSAAAELAAQDDRKPAPSYGMWSELFEGLNLIAF
jgi:hypothetical protein